MHINKNKENTVMYKNVLVFSFMNIFYFSNIHIKKKKLGQK